MVVGACPSDDSVGRVVGSSNSSYTYTVFPIVLSVSEYQTCRQRTRKGRRSLALAVDDQDWKGLKPEATNDDDDDDDDDV